ncbi:MAG: hypothetical protein ACQER7_00595 [Bacteroidota bacterium]
MTVIRKFPGKAIEMTLSSKTVVNSLKYYQKELSKVRPKWNVDYVTDLDSRIDDILENKLGLDVDRDLRRVTKRIRSVETLVLDDMSFLRDQIKVDFDAEEVTEILKSLGYTKYYDKARNSDTESLILFLSAFREEMTKDTRDKIVSAGASPEQIDQIIGYATEILEANTKQEYLKQSSVRLTAETTQILNDLYKEIIGICKIAASYYRHDPVKRREFIFSRVMARMRAQISVSSSDEPEVQE